MANYSKRVYKVIDGQLKKEWDGPKEGWFATKAEAQGDGGPDPIKEAEAELKAYESNTLTPPKKLGRPFKKG